MIDRDTARDLERLVHDPAWERLYVEMSRRVKLALDTAVSGGGLTDRERADAALVYRTIVDVIEWPSAMLREYLTQRGTDVDQAA